MLEFEQAILLKIGNNFIINRFCFLKKPEEVGIPEPFFDRIRIAVSVDKGMVLTVIACPFEGASLRSNGCKKEGNQIVVKLGTTAEIFARKYFKHAKMLVLDRESNCVLEVVQGKSNAFIYDQFSVLKDWQKYPEATRANLKPFIEEFWAIALRPEDKNLLKSVNDFLQNYRQQGGFQNLADKYFEKEQKLFAEQGVPFVFDIKATRKD